MSVARAAIIVIGLSLLLTWLSWRAINPRAEQFDRALAELDRFGLVQDTLYRDLFAARTGLLRNYDPLVNEIRALHYSLTRLQASASLDQQTSESVERLERSVDRQEQLIESFKSQNAVLHNSLSFFGRFGVRADLRELDLEIGAAAAAILHLTLDTSTVAVSEATKRLDDLELQAARTGQAVVVQPFLAHGRMLSRLLPSVDNILREMTAVPQKADQDALRGMILARQLASRREARSYRVLLYIASLLLVAFLVHLGIRLRARAINLHRRAALDHLLTNISMNFVNVASENIEAEIERALALLATHIDVDRAYLLVSKPAARPYLWHRENAAFPHGWPEAVPDLAARMGADRDSMINVPQVSRLPAGQNKSRLEDGGVGGWACAMSIDSEGNPIALGVDVVDPGKRILKTGELVLLRMALDTFTHAINRRAYEEERDRLQRRMQQASRMEKIGAFTSGVAHNFNNILGGILGHAELMEAQVGGHAGILRHLGGIRKTAERARDLIGQILAFGRYRERRRTAVSVEALAKETISLLRVTLPSEIELVVGSSAESMTVNGEGAQLQQVLMNLCQNAANAMDGKGRIQVIVDVCRKVDATALSHDQIKPGAYVRISVADAGIGMDGSVLDRLFEPFFTTRPDGNGLGLATVREIVRDHGGGIDVQSRPGEGSRFEVWLPLAATTARSLEQRSKPHAQGQGEVVMLVASDKERLLGDEEMLAALGYEGVGFMTAEAALEACIAMPDRFDFVVVGQLGSLAQSLETAGYLRRKLPSKPIVLAARASPEIDPDSLFAAGISDVVRWPILTEEIAIALSQFSETEASKSSARLHASRPANLPSVIVE